MSHSVGVPGVEIVIPPRKTASMIGVNAINRMTELGMPKSVAVVA